MNDVTDQMARFHQASTTGDLKTIRLIAHRLKSGSADLGALRLAELLKSLEIEADRGNAEVLALVTSEIEFHFLEVRQALLDLTTGDNLS